MQQNRAVGIAPQDQVRAALQQGNGNGVCCPPIPATTVCCLPNGKRGHTNETRYHRLRGRCLDPTDPSNYELIEPGTVCRKRRRMNPLNERALKTANRRRNRFVDAVKGSLPDDLAIVNRKTKTPAKGSRRRGRGGGRKRARRC